MQYAKQLSLAAIVVLIVWGCSADCPTSMAQDNLGDFRVASLDTTSQLRPVEEVDFAVNDSWGPQIPESQESAGTRSWTQRIAGLARGRAQLEGGYSFLRDSSGGESSSQHAAPDLLLRFGLTSRLELRVGWPGYVSNQFDDPVLGSWHSGTLDPNVGFAYDLWCQHGTLPQTAVLVAVPVKLAGNPFALNSLQPLAELMYGWQLGERTMLTGRSGFALFEIAGDNFAQFQQGLSVDVTLTPRVGTFASWNMLVDHGAWDNTSQHMVGSGLSYLLTDRLVISGRVAVGVNSAAPDFLSDLRFAYRF